MTGAPGDSDLADLLNAIGARQDRAAFQVLFTHFAPRLKAYMRRLGADDGAAEELVQETMLTVWNRAARFDRHLSSASTWLFTVARNKRIDRMRRSRHPELDPGDPNLSPRPEPAADRALELTEQADMLRTEIRQLPAEQAEILALTFFEDHSQSAIAKALDLPLGTVKSRMRLALARLRKAIGPDDAKSS